MAAKSDLERLTIIIPAYNEELVIRSVISELKVAFPDARIILVDDGSRDDTVNEAMSIPEITIISHDVNRGMGAALKTGMRAANSEFLAWYDADGQHSPEDLLKVALPVIKGERDVVIGARQKGSHNKPERIPGKFILKIIAQAVTGSPIPDLNSGLRCFRTQVIKRYLHLLPDSFSASSTSTLIMIKRGYRIGYVPILSRPRKGRSSVNIVRDGFLTMHLILRMLILFETFRFFTTLSLLQVIPGLAYGLYLTFRNKAGFPTFAVIIVISGILTFFMGIISDQISELRKERFEED